ncbi:MAG: hypothetical protein EBU25_08970, partial [Burkholderiaceae bacterium]|nr:hypothetical protein [Burkholderiaceae bacterium]
GLVLGILQAATSINESTVASILTSLGMVMVSPMMFSLPLKLIVFALADGWTLLSLSLVQSYFN